MMMVLASWLVLGSQLAFGSLDCSQSPVQGSKQLVLAIAPDWNSKTVQIQRFSGSVRTGWKSPDPAPFEGVIGRNGLGWGKGLHSNTETEPVVKREGDGRAPSGVFLLESAFGYHNETEISFRSPKHLPYTRVDQNSRCVDDGSSKFYNANVYDQTKVTKDWTSDEALARSDDLYEYAINVNHNGLGKDGTPVSGSGSCIFLHVWRAPDASGDRPGTAGCTAMSKEKIRELLGWLQTPARPVLVQLTLDKYKQFQKPWCLPEIDFQRRL